MSRDGHTSEHLDDVQAQSGRNEIDAVRAAVSQLPYGEITDDDLARVGVTSEQWDRLVDADIDRKAAEHRAEEQAAADFQAWWRERLAGDQIAAAVRSCDSAMDELGEAEQDTEREDRITRWCAEDRVDAAERGTDVDRELS